MDYRVIYNNIHAAVLNGCMKVVQQLLWYLKGDLHASGRLVVLFTF